jgi:hypothetical protein
VLSWAACSLWQRRRTLTAQCRCFPARREHEGRRSEAPRHAALLLGVARLKIWLYPLLLLMARKASNVWIVCTLEGVIAIASRNLSVGHWAMTVRGTWRLLLAMIALRVECNAVKTGLTTGEVLCYAQLRRRLRPRW